ncbi:hypothetical protein [Streptomyces sp. IMTB 2501]|uniref:hypothetical protein n=1 Tax=Streptomyces sp. IMTB 2501 TaxID=1776340 RepID=UPI002115CF1B|nr:hypothetical protein [Streptomyces sp. IMTB 2501]
MRVRFNYTWIADSENVVLVHEPAWYAVRAGDRTAVRDAWEFTALPHHPTGLQSRIAFAWRAMDAIYEENERVLGDTVIARSGRPVVLFETETCDARTGRGPPRR